MPLTPRPPAASTHCAADPAAPTPSGSQAPGRTTQPAPELSALAREVLEREATERPFSSALNQESRAGTFLCAGCGQPLFASTTKYDSGSGWPSFFEPLPGAVQTKRDTKLLMTRTEYHCSQCGGHQGHVFEDGPNPTGLRYCNNGVALRFVPQSEAND